MIDYEKFYTNTSLKIRIIIGVGYTGVIFGNPRSKSSNERGFSPEHFGTNIKAIGQKLRWSRPKTYHRGGVLSCD